MSISSTTSPRCLSFTSHKKRRLALLLLPLTSAQKDVIWALQWAGPRLVSGGADGIIRLHDPTDLTLPINELPALPLAISSLSASADGKWAIATSLDGTAGLVDVQRGKWAGKVETGREGVRSGESELPAFTSALHPKAECWAWTGRGARVAIRRIEGNALSEVDGDAEVEGKGPLGVDGSTVEIAKGRFGMGIEFSPDGTQLAVSTESGHVSIIDVETSTVVANYAAHAMTARAVAWSPDSQWLYSGADDARVVLHDVRAGGSGAGKGEGAVAIMQGHQRWVLSAAASPDGKLLGTGGADSLVKLWDVGQRACVSTSTVDAEVWGIAWQPEYEGSLPPGKQFAIAGEDSKISLYRAAGAV